MGRGLSMLAAVVLLAGCTKSATNNQLEYNANVITEEEIDASGAQTAYDAVKKLRSNFLASRGRTTINNANSPQEPMVFLDNQLYGPLNSMKQIPSSQIGRIQLYRAWEATTKYGAGYMAGVIALTSRQ